MQSGADSMRLGLVVWSGVGPSEVANLRRLTPISVGRLAAFPAAVRE